MDKKRKSLSTPKSNSNTPSEDMDTKSESLVEHHIGPAKQMFPQPTNNLREPTKLHDFMSFVAILVGAFIVAWLLIAFCFQQYEVNGPSMQPTLQTGNRLIVLKISKTWSDITGHPYIPNRGDIVVFEEINLYALDEVNSNQLVKRVIGLPGDRVVIKNGILTIFNKQHPKGFRPDAVLPYGKVIGYTGGSIIDEVVPANQIFVCGDNRNDSLDSRDFGTVPVKYIVGKLVLRITPLNEIRVW
jgi:signal peptidase I